jgi:hypothetical protein
MGKLQIFSVGKIDGQAFRASTPTMLSHTIRPTNVDSVLATGLAPIYVLLHSSHLGT